MGKTVRLWLGLPGLGQGGCAGLAPHQATCCTATQPCGEGGGDCDQDVDCGAGLVCGTDNCRQFNKQAHKDYDCCAKAGRVHIELVSDICPPLKQIYVDF